MAASELSAAGEARGALPLPSSCSHGGHPDLLEAALAAACTAAAAPDGTGALSVLGVPLPYEEIQREVMSKTNLPSSLVCGISNRIDC